MSRRRSKSEQSPAPNPAAASSKKLKLDNFAGDGSTARKSRLSSAETDAVGPQRHFSTRRFSEAPISEKSKAGIKHEFMTDVQALTIDPGLSGSDLLVQAKTGTGKTIAFLLPAIERLLRRTELPVVGDISILVLSPTRELACQIEEEAKVLLSHHKPLSVRHAIGGTNINTDIKTLTSRKSRTDILVATPGRLLDLLTNQTLGQHLLNLSALVFDEADRLLDAGFRTEITKILQFLPPRETRQNLLFSATISKDVRQIATLTLRPGHLFISTLLPDEVNTHEHVTQHIMTVNLEDLLPTTLTLLRADLVKNPRKSKVLVFFPTARGTGIAADVLNRLSVGPALPPIFEIHSRRSQSARSKAADAFRAASTAVLLSSDVAARGMDFPGVTLVLQVGLPASAEQYIHRLGRTARAGADGYGILLLTPVEKFFLKLPAIRNLPITPLPSPTLGTELAEINEALITVPDEAKAQAYQAWLGYYKGFLRPLGYTPERLVQEANRYASEACRYTGRVPPPLLAKTVGKMGLKGVHGLNVVQVLPGAHAAGKAKRIVRKDTSTPNALSDLPPDVSAPNVARNKNKDKSESGKVAG